MLLQFDVIRFMIGMWGDKVEERFKVVTDRILEGCLYARNNKGKLVIISMFLDPYTENEMERRLSMAFKKRCEAEGFPVFPTLREAVRTVSNMYKYVKIKRRKSFRGAGAA
jgi:hypothetical protein